MPRLSLPLLALLALPSAAFSQTVDNQFKDWTVFTHEGLCYIGTAPKDAAQKDPKPYLLVTHRKKDVREISVSLGGAFKPDAEVNLSVAKQNFKLFSQGSVAWARDEATDAKIVAALGKAGSATVKGTLADGKAVTQKFSLSGLAAALKRMSSLCQ